MRGRRRSWGRSRGRDGTTCRPKCKSANRPTACAKVQMCDANNRWRVAAPGGRWRDRVGARRRRDRVEVGSAPRADLVALGRVERPAQPRLTGPVSPTVSPCGERARAARGAAPTSRQADAMSSRPYLRQRHELKGRPETGMDAAGMKSFSGPRSQPPGIRFRCSGSGTGPGPDSRTRTCART